MATLKELLDIEGVRPHATGCLPGQRSSAHRRCGRLLGCHLDKREGDRGQGGATRRLPGRVPLPRDASQEPNGGVKRPSHEANFVQENLASLLPDAPQITAGEVVAHKAT
jgi:hypothetical protein